MIFIKDKIFMKVWKITKSEKYLDLQGTTGEKNQDGTWANSYWHPRVIGKAFNALNGKLNEGDTIVITQCKISNESYTDKEGNKKNFFRMLVLDAEVKGAPSKAINAPAKRDDFSGEDDSNEDPW